MSPTGAPRPRLTRDEILAALRRRARRTGRAPRARELSVEDRAVWNDLFLYFDGLHAALDAAGIERAPFPSKWTKPIVIAQLQALDARDLRMSGASLAHRGHRGLVNAARDLFGTYAAALRAAKVAPAPPGRRGASVWSPEEVIAQILERHGRRQPLASTRVPRKLRDAAIYYHGGWREAVERAGIDYASVRIVRQPWTKPELLSHLRRLATSLPRMTITELHRQPVATALYQRFGSIPAALRAAGLDGWPARVRHTVLSRAETLRLLRDRHRAGLPNVYSAAVRDDSRMVTAAIRHFGAWRAALEAADLRRA